MISIASLSREFMTTKSSVMEFKTFSRISNQNPLSRTLNTTNFCLNTSPAKINNKTFQNKEKKNPFWGHSCPTGTLVLVPQHVNVKDTELTDHQTKNYSIAISMQRSFNKSFQFIKSFLRYTLFKNPMIYNASPIFWKNC